MYQVMNFSGTVKCRLTNDVAPEINTCIIPNFCKGKKKTEKSPRISLGRFFHTYPCQVGLSNGGYRLLLPHNLIS
jgi:hypothetical protein